MIKWLQRWASKIARLWETNPENTANKTVFLQNFILNVRVERGSSGLEKMFWESSRTTSWTNFVLASAIRSRKNPLGHTVCRLSSLHLKEIDYTCPTDVLTLEHGKSAFGQLKTLKIRQKWQSGYISNPPLVSHLSPRLNTNRIV